MGMLWIPHTMGALYLLNRFILEEEEGQLFTLTQIFFDGHIHFVQPLVLAGFSMSADRVSEVHC
jgi:hypothetical protein